MPKSLRSLPIILLAIAIVSLGVAKGEAPLLATTVAEPIPDASAAPCDLFCWTFNCPAEWHLAFIPEDGYWKNVQWGTGPHYDFNCYEGVCGGSNHSSDCEMIMGLEDLRQALALADAATTAALILESDGRVTMNLKRSALQGVDCRGRVVAHLPMSTSLARNVQGALNRTGRLEHMR